MKKITIDIILTNEKYRGDGLLQKRFIVNFLEHKLKKKQGQAPQYYVENSHPAIIGPIEWEQAQVEFARRFELGRTYSSKSIFSSKLVCEDCGGFYGQKGWHFTCNYKKVIWQYNKKFKDKEEKCKTLTLTVETIQMMYLDAYNNFMGNGNRVLDDCELIRKALMVFTNLDTKIEKQYEEIKVIAERVKNPVKENASSLQSQDEYIKK